MSKPKSKKTVQIASEKSPFSLGVDAKVFIGLIVLTFLLYANTIGHGFVLDDPLSIGLNKNVTSGFDGIWNIITGSYRDNNFGGQFYRPISLVLFAIEWKIAPNNPFIHHFFNVFWYALSIVLVYKSFKNWLTDTSFIIPLFIALLFAVHPIHTEVVANIKSRDEIMSLFFLLTSFITWHRYMKGGKNKWLIYSIVLYLFTLLSKESGITMFPVFGMLSYWVYKQSFKKAVLQGIWFVVPVLIIFGIRWMLFSGQAPPTISIMDNPIVGAEGFLQKLATSLVILGKYAYLLFVPYPLSSDYSYSVIPLGHFSDVKVIMSIIVHISLMVYAIMRTNSRDFIALCIWCYFLAIALFSQIPMTIGTMFGERLVYMASFWWVGGLVVAVGASRIRQHSKILSAFGILIAVIFSVLTFERNKAWKDNLTLFTTDAATYPNSVRLNNGAAESTVQFADLPENEGRKFELYDKAEAYCNQILQIKPVPTAYLTLGNIRLKQGRYEEAIKFYDQVNDLKNIVDANKALTFREWGRYAGEKEQNIEKSMQLLNQSLALNSDDAETWFVLGVCYGVLGDHNTAAQKFEKAYTLHPIPAYANNAYQAYQRAGNEVQASEFQKLATK